MIGGEEAWALSGAVTLDPEEGLSASGLSFFLLLFLFLPLFGGFSPIIWNGLTNWLRKGLGPIEQRLPGGLTRDFEFLTFGWSRGAAQRGQTFAV